MKFFKVNFNVEWLFANQKDNFCPILYLGVVINQLRCKDDILKEHPEDLSSSLYPDDSKDIFGGSVALLVPELWASHGLWHIWK